MELHKFHVTDFGTRAIGHGYSVAGCNSRICSIAVDLAESARSEKHGTCIDLLELPSVVEHPHSNDPSFTHHELGGEFELPKDDGLQRPGLKEERTADLTA